MALLIENEYPGKSAPASAAYPQGAARNITAPGDGLGTPLEKEWVNDLFGLQQALLAAAGLTPSGSPDTALASQYLQGIIQQVQGRASLFNDTGAANAYIVGLRTNQQAPGAVFDGQRFRIVPTVTSTGAATIDISALLGQAAATTIINIKLKGGSTNPSAGVIIAGEEIGFIYRTSPGIHAQLDSAFAGDASFAGIVDILGGTVKLNGATMSGAQVIIADNAVAPLIFPNRSFGMLNLTEGADGDNAPRANVFFSGYVDFGPSPSIDTAIKGSFLQTNSVDTPTGSTGTDGRVTIFVAGVDGTLYVENRDGASRTFNINLV
jgi:hypothetical protein